jgi:hypothetical protein
VVTGSTALLNRPLADLCGPIPAEAAMHDWWVALVAAALGKVTHIAAPTVLYRQHDANRIGVGGGRNAVVPESPRARGAGGPLLPPDSRPARAFLERYAQRLSDADRATLEAYCALDGLRAPARRWRQLRGGFTDSGLLRNAALALLG